VFTISAIVPNYNHSRYLRESIEGLANQTFPPVEIIIVDDASIDNSWEVLQELKRQIPQIQLLRNESNLGPYRTAFRGIALAKGAFLALCAADDMLFPNAFEEYSKIVSDKDFDVGICTSDPVLFMDERPYKYVRSPVLKTRDSQIFSADKTIFNCRNNDFTIFSSAAIYRKDIFLKYGYDESLNCFSDFYLNCQIALNHSVAYVPKGLGAFRVVAESYSQKARKNFRLRTASALSFFKKLDAEPTQIKKKFKKSGILSCGGYFFLLFLILHPRSSKYIPSMIWGVFRKKIKIFVENLKKRRPLG